MKTSTFLLSFFTVAILLVGCAADDTATVIIENPNGGTPTGSGDTEIGGTLSEDLTLEADYCV